MLKKSLIMGLIALFCLGSTALAEDSALLVGVDGSFWGTTEKHVRDTAPGAWEGVETMGPMKAFIFIQQTPAGVVETGYTLRDNSCWKVSHTVEGSEQVSVEDLERLFDQTVEALNEILGEPEESTEWYAGGSMVTWKTEKTNATANFNRRDQPGDSRVDVSFESRELVRAIFGKSAD